MSCLDAKSHYNGNKNGNKIVSCIRYKVISIETCFSFVIMRRLYSISTKAKYINHVKSA